MKLKLENPDPLNPGLTTLIVTESIEPAHIAVLKAGLTKLFQSGKKTILLDFSAVQATGLTTPTISQEILALRVWASASDAQVLVVSPIETLGHAKTREDAIKIVNSSEGPLLALEAKLQAEFKAVSAKKAELEGKLAQANAAGDPKVLLRTKSDLTRAVNEAQRITARFLKNRSSDPFSLPAFQLANEALEEILVTVLKKEGVLS
jgi:hypothetical protein